MRVFLYLGLYFVWNRVYMLRTCTLYALMLVLMIRPAPNVADFLGDSDGRYCRLVSENRDAAKSDGESAKKEHPKMILCLVCTYIPKASPTLIALEFRSRTQPVICFDVVDTC